MSKSRRKLEDPIPKFRKKVKRIKNVRPELIRDFRECQPPIPITGFYGQVEINQDEKVK
jgi:hypothetical protein